MAHNSKTDLYKQMRENVFNTVHIKVLQPSSNGLLLEDEDHSMNNQVLPIPLWLRPLELIKLELTKLERQLEGLPKMYKNQHINSPSLFTKEQTVDTTIDSLITEIIQKIKDIKQQTNNLGSGYKLSHLESILKHNIQSNIGTKLQVLSTILNKSQKVYIKNVQEQIEKKKKINEFENLTLSKRGYFTNEEESDKKKEFNVSKEDDDDDKSWLYNGNFDSFPKEMKQIDPDQELYKERDREIAIITEQMREITKVFNELAEMVVEQGTILDRIDENIVSASQNIDQGINHLAKAASSESKYRSRLLWVLAVIFVACTVIVIIISATK